jgi:hypothetical protein
LTERGRRNSVSSFVNAVFSPQDTDLAAEHTLLVTETGVEILTARKADSPGGPIPMPATGETNGTK